MKANNIKVILISPVNNPQFAEYVSSVAGSQVVVMPTSVIALPGNKNLRRYDSPGTKKLKTHLDKTKKQSVEKIKMSLHFKLRISVLDLTSRYPILNDIDITFKQGDFALFTRFKWRGKALFVRTISELFQNAVENLLLAADIKISMVPQFKKMQFQYPLTVKVLLLSEKFTLFPKII